MSTPVTILIGSNTSTKPFESNLNVDNAGGWVDGLVLQAADGTYTRVGARLKGTSIVRVWPNPVVVGGGTPTPTYNATYQATQADYQAKCSVAPPAGYTYPTGSGSGTTQEAANTAAKANAIAQITCPVPQVNYEWTLTGPSDADSTGVTLTTDGSAYQLNYDRIFNGDSTAKRMDLFLGGNQLAAVDFPASYLGGKPFVFKIGSSRYTGTFTDGSVTLS